MKKLALILLTLALASSLHAAKKWSDKRPDTASSMLAGEVLMNATLLRIRLKLPIEADLKASDVDYAVVNSEWIKGFYAEWRKAAFERGLIQYCENFDCNKFADLFVIDAQLAYMKQGQKQRLGAESMAVGVLQYRPSMIWGATTDHAIVVFITEKGPMYLEPQSGEIMKLSEKECEAVFYVRM